MLLLHYGYLAAKCILIGHIRRRDQEGQFNLYISFIMVIPLLRPDLNDVERMQIEWYIGIVFVHETIVSLKYLPRRYLLQSLPDNLSTQSGIVSHMNGLKQNAIWGILYQTRHRIQWFRSRITLTSQYQSLASQWNMR
jgi:hypothetical protein